MEATGDVPPTQQGLNDEDTDDSEHECLDPDCDRSFDSDTGMKIHFGRAHDVEPLVLDEIRAVADRLGRAPTAGEMSEYGIFSAPTCGKPFGGWNNALEAAGFDLRRHYDVDNEALLEEIRRLESELGRTPKINEMGSLGKYSRTLYQDEFGTWNEALEAAGCSLNRHHSINEEELIDELQRLEEELDRTPVCRDAREESTYAAKTFQRYFGGWSAAIEAAGMEPFEAPCGEDHWLWNGGGHDVPLGAGYGRTKDQVMERDDHQCQIEGCSNDDDGDCRIHVHHIVRRRAFHKRDLPVGDSNVPRNLITLCARHHRKVEVGKLECPYPPEHPRGPER